jgi:hypothetical protein
LSLRQAEEAGYGYSDGGFEAWGGGSYGGYGSGTTATATTDGEGSDGEDVQNADNGAAHEPVAETSFAEAEDTAPKIDANSDNESAGESEVVTTKPEDQPGSTEPAANGTARVPER